MFTRRRDKIEMPTFGGARFAEKQDVVNQNMLGNEGIRLGYFREAGHRWGWGEVIRYAGDAGLITIAPARFGKTRDLLAGVLLDYDQSVVAIDPKSQLACLTAAQRKRMGQEVYFLNPLGEHADVLGPSHCYNPLDLIDPSAVGWETKCRKIAEALIAAGEGKDGAHWISGARGLVAGLIGGLVAHGSEDTKNLARVREILCDDALLQQYARASRKSPHAFIRQELASYTMAEPPNPAEIAGFKQTAREQTAFLGIKPIADSLSRSDFRFFKLKEKAGTVFIILPDDQLSACGPWFRLIVASAFDELWQGGRGKYRVLAILDEFAQIGFLSVLLNATAAAAGRGILMWPIVQNIPQLKKDYGEAWESFLSGADIRIFGAPRDQTTADFMSKQAGQRTVLTAGQSVHNNGPLGANKESDATNQTGQPLIRPEETMKLGKNEMIIFGPENIVIDALRRPYFHTPEYDGLYDADPMHKNDSDHEPPIRPEKITTFADALFANEEQAKRARNAARPLALRLMTWGGSHNSVLNIIRKAGFVLTLPLRLLLALLTAPFAIQGRPLRAVVAFVALFGFWEVWNDFAKQPIVSLYQMKAKEYQTEALLKDENSMGDMLNSNYRAAKWLIGLPFRAVFQHEDAKSAQADLALLRSQASARGAVKRLDDVVERISHAMDNESSHTFDQSLSNLHEAGDRTTEEAFHKADESFEAIRKRIAEEDEQRAKTYIQEGREEAEKVIKSGGCVNKPWKKWVREPHVPNLLPCDQLYQPLDEANVCHGDDDCRDYVTRLQGEAEAQKTKQ